MTSSTPRSFILGTAGHIDHGKSTLITCLTGTNPDRLIEEQQRGMTIELGFAQLILPSARSIGVVDVPGHQAFVRHMIAGATGVDIALLVVAADDGIMPQTVEHLHILNLLGVKRLIIAITKCDLADDDLIDLVELELAELLNETAFSFETTPVIRVSNTTGQGHAELLTALDQMLDHLQHEQTAQAGARLPIDRVFTLTGIGTVVTGTLWGGALSTEDVVYHYPSQQQMRIRSLQVHGDDHRFAQAGQRTALCLQGVSKDAIHRGDMLSTQALHMTDHVDVHLTYLGAPSKPQQALISGTQVHINHGTTQVLGRVLLMNHQSELACHAQAFAQIRFDEPLAIQALDRLIVRSFSPVELIGGALVLNAHPKRRTIISDDEQAFLQARLERNTPLALQAYLNQQPYPRTVEAIARDLDLEPAYVLQTLNQLDPAPLMWDDNNQHENTARLHTLVTTASTIERCTHQIEQYLLDMHRAHPDIAGVTRQTLATSCFPACDERAVNHLIDCAVNQQRAWIAQGLIGHPSILRDVIMAREEGRRSIQAALTSDQVVALTVQEIVETTNLSKSLVNQVIQNLALEGAVVRIGAGIIMDASCYTHTQMLVAQHLHQHGESSTSDLRELLKTNRKTAIALLEYFDKQRITQRSGEGRVLGARGQELIGS